MVGASRIRPASAADGIPTITAPDTVGVVGEYTSLVLDAAGNPVVSYFDATNSDLKLLHCNDLDCAGGDESITAPDTAGSVGSHTSLVLDASGNPVISYNDATNSRLKLLHCNDPNCVGDDESITAPDGVASLWTSLELDASGNPVVSYYDATNAQLKLLHCNDPNCAGGDESITTPDPGSGGSYTSLVLDGSGNPVVSYHSNAAGRLALLHCNDPDCVGGDESITFPSPFGAGFNSALVLDSAGNPVISHVNEAFTSLPVLVVVHCNDPNCAGDDESVSDPNDFTEVFVFSPTSIVLDIAGNPAIVYYETGDNSVLPAGGDLKLVHCNDPNCLGGDDSNVTVSETLGAGLYPSLVLNAGGDPIVSYFDSMNGHLKLLHCGDPNCAKAAPTATPCPSGKVPSGVGGCGTPAPTPTPGLSPEMLLNIKGGDCDDSERPTACDVAVGGEFLLSVDAVVVPLPGYVLMQTFVAFGPDLTYKPSDSLTDEIVWPDCQPQIAVRTQIDQTLPLVPHTNNSQEVVSHGCLTGLLPPVPASHYVGNVVEFTLTCSSDPSGNLIELLPYVWSFTLPAGDVAGTSGALFTDTSFGQIVPIVSNLTINCVDVVPVAVGGVALGGELRGIAAQHGNVPWLWAALGIGAIAALSVLAIARRRQPVRGRKLSG